MSVSGRILNVEHKPYEWNGKTNDKWEVSIQVGSDTVKYNCFNKDIAGMSGKDIVDYPTEPSKKPGYPDTIKLPRDIKSFTGGSKSYRQFDASQAKVMILSYSKDAVVELIRKSDKSQSPNHVADAIITIYDKLSKHILTEEKTEPKADPKAEPKKVTAQEVADDEIPF